MIWSAWWFWIAAALVLGILEVLVPALIFLGVALGALAMGLLLALGWFTVTGPWAFALFSLLSLMAYIGLRLGFGRKRGQVKRWDRDINDG